MSLVTMERFARIWSSPGVSTERQSLLLASYVAAIGSERAVVSPARRRGCLLLRGPLSNWPESPRSGRRFIDDTPLTLVLALRARRPELFARRFAPTQVTNQTAVGCDLLSAAVTEN
jgi:hypothetical protein